MKNLLPISLILILITLQNVNGNFDPSTLPIIVDPPPPPLPFLPSNPLPPPTPHYCHKRQVQKSCQSLEDPITGSVTTCFGVKLPYKFTSPELVNVNFTQNQIQSELKRWQGLQKSVPRCWAVIQPLLCSIYLPRCVDNFVDLPPQDLCRITRTPCLVIEKVLKELPPILKCEDVSRFPPPACKINNDYIRELPWNTSSGTCMSPLEKMESVEPDGYQEGFEGCAFNCGRDPVFGEEDHGRMARVVWWGAVGGGLGGLWVVASFLVDWRSGKGYPAVTLFYANVWWMVAVVGWGIQWLPGGTREGILCRKDGTGRRSEPASGENLLCPVVFAMIYFGLMSALAWLSVFAYVWFLACDTIGRTPKRSLFKNSRIYFNFITFLLPLVLTILCFSKSIIGGGGVSASPILGICFLSFSPSSSSTSKILLFLLPILLMALWTILFLSRGIHSLWTAYLSLNLPDNPNDPSLAIDKHPIPKQGKAVIKVMALRAAAFLIGLISLLITYLYFQIKLITQRPLWDKSLEQFIFCKMNIRLTDDYPQECEISEKGDVSLMIGLVLPFFLGGGLLSSWGWSSKAALGTWRRWLMKRCKMSGGGKIEGVDGGGGVLRKQVYDDPLGINMLLDHRRLLGLPPLGGEDGEGEEFLGESQAYPPSFTDGESMMSGATWGMVGVGVDDSRRGSFESNVEGGGGGKNNGRRRDWFERMTSRHNGRRWGGGGRRGVGGGSSTSLASSTGSQILHAVTALIDKRLGLGRWGWGGNGGGRDERVDGAVDRVDVALQEGGLLGQGDGGGGGIKRVTLIVREMGVQTSLEDLRKGMGDGNGNGNGVEKGEMGTQADGVDLREIGTQTKKSATKKMGRGRREEMEEEDGGAGGELGGGGGGGDVMDLDAVEKLLSPN